MYGGILKYFHDILFRYAVNGDPLQFSQSTSDWKIDDEHPYNLHLVREWVEKNLTMREGIDSESPIFSAIVESIFEDDKEEYLYSILEDVQCASRPGEEGYGGQEETDKESDKDSDEDSDEECEETACDLCSNDFTFTDGKDIVVDGRTEFVCPECQEKHEELQEEDEE